MSNPWASRPQQSRWSASSAASRPTTSPLQLLNRGGHIVYEDGAAAGAPSRPPMKMPLMRTGMAAATASSTVASSSATNPRQVWTKGSPIVFSRNTAVASPGPSAYRPMPRAVSASMAERARQRTAAHQRRRSSHTGVGRAFPQREGSQTSTTASSDKENAGASDKEAASEKDKDKEEEASEVLPPQTDLPMKIPLDLFRAARDAPPGSPESFWTYTLYRREGEDTNPGAHSQVKVHYSRSLHTTERVCLDYFVGEPVLGFDLEWMASATRRDGARRNVCLVQLASPTRIGLFHLSLYPSKDALVAPTLRRILEDPGVVKAGVFIKGDCTRLRNYLQVDVRGSLELSHLHKLVKYSQTGDTHLINKRLVSLADQVQEHLRLPMFKGMDVRAGDWSKPLQMDQIIYSASDAYAAVQIYAVLEKQRLALHPTPPRPEFAELGLPIKLADGVTTITTAAEEAAEEDTPCPADGAQATPLSPETARVAQTSIQFESDSEGDSHSGDSQETPSEGDSATAAPRPRKSPVRAKAPTHPRIVEANNWVASYRAQGKKVRVPPACLRAYYLWHGKDGMDPVALAALLRDPPLLTTTVIGYVLQAVQLERLPYDKERLRSELLSNLPENVVRSRYSSVAWASGFKLAPGGTGGGFKGRFS